MYRIYLLLASHFTDSRWRTKLVSDRLNGLFNETVSFSLTFSLIPSRISHHRGQYHNSRRDVKGRITFSASYIRFIENDSSKSDQSEGQGLWKKNRTWLNTVWAKILVFECDHSFCNLGKQSQPEIFVRTLPENLSNY